MKTKLSTLLLFLSTVSFASEFTITEKSLLSLAKESNPSLEEIESNYLNSKAQYMELEDKFGFELYSNYGHTTTKEKSSIIFQPIFDNVNNYKLGVKKYTKYGLVIDANTSVNQSSGASESGSNYKDLHTTTYQLGFQVDLWKDLLGRSSKRQFENLADMKKKDELQSNISKSAFEINVRKIYWSLVANQEKLNINNNLYKMSQRQLKDARARKANSVSDRAEVARFESLVYQRKGQIILLNYEKEVLLKNLRELFPTLNAKSLKLGAYNIDNTVLEVLACSAQIDNEKSAPYQYTSYDEVTSFLRAMQTRQSKLDQVYDDIDLKAEIKLSQVGVSSQSDNGNDFYGDYNDSIDDLRDNDRGAFQAGLNLTIPFGENKAATTAVKEKLTEAQFRANIEKLDSQVKATHEQVQKSVRLLAQLIQTQKSNSKSLGIRVKEMRRKYNQARIPEYALIQDQDSLLQSDLSVVDTQLQVVNTILDYLSVFNTFPCTFNRK